MPHTHNPISDKQLAANRANAEHSTGPRTPKGKTRSAQNSRKHGFTASHFAVLRLEDLQAIENLKTDLVSVYQPVNSQELLALERMALAQHSIFRAATLETGLLTTCLNEAMDQSGRPLFLLNKELTGDIEITRAQNRNYCLAEGFHRMIRQGNCWSLFLRYQAQTERHYRRAVEEFERLKALRGELPNEAISDGQLEENATTCTPSETDPLLPEGPDPNYPLDDAGPEPPPQDATPGAPAAPPLATPNHTPTDPPPTESPKGPAPSTSTLRCCRWPAPSRSKSRPHFCASHPSAGPACRLRFPPFPFRIFFSYTEVDTGG